MKQIISVNQWSWNLRNSLWDLQRNFWGKCYGCGRLKFFLWYRVGNHERTKCYALKEAI